MQCFQKGTAIFLLAGFASLATAQCQSPVPTYGAPTPTTCNNVVAVTPTYAASCGAQTCATPAMSWTSAACGSCGQSGCGGSCLGGGRRAGGNMLGNLMNSQSSGLWFGSVYYLNLTREDDDIGRHLAHPDGFPEITALTTGEAQMGSADGIGVRFGRKLGNNHAFAFNYWQLFPEGDGGRARLGNVFTRGVNVGDYTDYADAWDFNHDYIYSNIQFGDLVAPDGTNTVWDYFSRSGFQEVRRNFDYRNFEWNFFRHPYTMNCGLGANFAFLAGIRYFRADEELSFFSDDNDNIPGGNRAAELIYASEVENHLAGFQVGTIMEYYFTSRLGVRFTGKTGIYGNRIESWKGITDGNNNFATFGGGADAGRDFDIKSEEEDLSFVSELDLGLTLRLTDRWSLIGGFRAFAISGYADAVDQIPSSFNSFDSAAVIQNQGSLILHGGYVGGEFVW